MVIEAYKSLCDILDQERKRVRNWRALSLVCLLIGFWIGYFLGG